MAKSEQDDNDNGFKQSGNYLKFTGIAFQMIVIIGALAYAGYKIDQSANHQVKWATAALSLLGVFISLYIIIKSVKS